MIYDLRREFLLAIHIRAQYLGDDDTAIGLLIIFHHGEAGTI